VCFHLIYQHLPARLTGGLGRHGPHLRPVYNAATEQAATETPRQVQRHLGRRVPRHHRPVGQRLAWAEFAPLLAYDAEICRVIYSTNAIESLHARMRRATRAKGHFPNEALKCLYMVVRSLDPAAW
jgi:putative transposase